MTDHITLEALDADGAIQEAAYKVDPEGAATRADFFKKAAIGGGALVAGGVVFGGLPALALGAPSKKQDVDILNYALTLEYLETEFYTQAVKQAGLSGDALDLAKEIRDNEAEHVDALAAAAKQLGGKPAAKPTFDFGGAFGSEKSYLKLANTLEDTGVSAYNGAGPAIESPEILGAAGSIVQVEARHAALIRLARGVAPAPLAFDKTSTVDEVLAAVKPLIKA